MPQAPEYSSGKLQAACRDRDLCGALLRRLEKTLAGRRMNFMEVCGTHTVAIFQSGLRSLLPGNIRHLSGPGCPVCVTHESEVALFMELSSRADTLLATFGDLLRVPGPDGKSLKHAMANGADIHIVYSPLEALSLARANPEKETVFLGIGFETTAPTVAASIISAKKAGIANFSVLSLHKLVPPALDALLKEKDCGVDAFLLPGHVATITGVRPFSFLVGNYRKPAAIGGFEPADILLALCGLAEQLAKDRPFVQNAYPRAVADDGNPRARELLNEIFIACDAQWRGLGKIPASGLSLRDEYSQFDAMKKLGLTLPETAPIRGCLCGSVLKGRIQPEQCPLFGKECAPATPVGPCMVSTEGSCAAHYKYGKLP